jgi:hypothetical protein
VNQVENQLENQPFESEAKAAPEAVSGTDLTDSDSASDPPHTWPLISVGLAYE